ncbi:MAG: amidohydrolase family protein [Candidatus Bathyarchaeota archaeon]|nr:amidohydrolase family protein [Candidatus Bathyarchaeota archaeon]
MRVDVHNHIGYDPAYDVTRTAEELLAEMKKNDVSKCVVFPFTSNPDFREQNKLVKQAMDKNPDKFIGFFLMNPRVKDMTDLMYMYKEQGFSGVVTDPRFSVDHAMRRFHELVECALVLNLPVWLHSDDKDTMRVYISTLESMLNKYVQVKFILSSMYYDAAGIAARHMNVFMDTATDMSGSMTFSKTQPIGTHRILMGANTPYGMLRREVEKIRDAPEFTEFQRTLIYYDNAKRLFNL